MAEFLFPVILFQAGRPPLRVGIAAQLQGDRPVHGLLEALDDQGQKDGKEIFDPGEQGLGWRDPPGLLGQLDLAQVLPHLRQDIADRHEDVDLLVGQTGIFQVAGIF